MSNERLARNLGIESITISLERGENKKQWKNPVTQEWDTIERATLSYFQLQGWLGYWDEGRLLLNLITAMCYPEFNYRFKNGGGLPSFEDREHKRLPYYESKPYDAELLLSNIKKATVCQIRNNFQIMISKEIYNYTQYYHGPDFVLQELPDGSIVMNREKIVHDRASISQTSTECILDIFPDLEFLMFEQLFQILGNDKIYEIAKVCATDTREYTFGWPDIIMWKEGHVKFVEVKAPKDHLQKNQLRIIQNIIKPLRLEFLLVDVLPSNQI